MLFLHQLTFSTKIFICRKTNIFIFNALANKDTCRKSNRVVYMYYVEKIFFGYVFWRSLSGRAIQGFRPHRSSTLQVRPSLAMLRLFSHCKGKTRLLRTAPLHSAMQGQALRVWMEKIFLLWIRFAPQ